jgi:glycosyltransferase involved in cell wall biosynthesis
MIKISIVTVVKNDCEGIEKTILSVLNQSYTNIQYIIIDGKSEDGTWELINKYASHLDNTVSEQDGGIYDAMNRALFFVEGDWVLFLNSSDFLHDEDVIMNFCEYLTSNPVVEIIRGSALYSYKNSNVALKIPRSNFHTWRGMPHSHQCQFTKSDLAKAFPFNTNLRYSADFDFYLKMINKGVRIGTLDTVISVCDYSKGFSKMPNLTTLYLDFIKIHFNFSKPHICLLVLFYVPIEILFLNMKRLLQWLIR